MISQNDQDHQLAIQAAEATLRFAETGIGTTYAAFSANTNGQYTWASGTEDYYLQYNLNSPVGALLTYGGTALPVSGTPEFMIESMPAIAVPGASLSDQQFGAPTPTVDIYRITAYSYGGDQNTTAELQEIDWQ